MRKEIFPSASFFSKTRRRGKRNLEIGEENKEIERERERENIKKLKEDIK